MKAAWQHQQNRVRRNSAHLTLLLTLSVITGSASAATQIVLERGSQGAHAGQYTGVVDLAVNPGFDNARVTVVVDGQKVT